MKLKDNSIDNNTERVKYVVINIKKEAQDLYTKNYKTLPGVVAHACNPSTLRGGDRRIWVRGQPQRTCARVRSLSLSLST